MAASESVCPVCLRPNINRRIIESAVPYQTGGELENRDSGDIGFLIDCPACGEFVVTRKDDVNLQSARLRSEWNYSHLSALLREQSIRSLPKFWLQYGMAPYGPLQLTNLAPIDLNELLTRWPRTVPERIDRTLSNLASLSPNGGHRVEMHDSDTALTFSENLSEALYVRRALIEQNFLDHLPPERGTSHLTVWVTPKGWTRHAELTQGKNTPMNRVFVAMWFGDTDEKTNMDEAFQQAIQPAIERAGYRATRVDLSQHNDWIMDKVLGDIRVAPFVVADFTGNRNGVYLEAGFARGLRIPVIHTCREDHFLQTHFDTKQLNHVLWKTPEELRNKLYYRIVGTVGPGPHPPVG